MFGRRPLFQVLGIPVTIDPMFLLGMFILYQVTGGGRVGLFTAVGIAAFTLIHELGHALTARAYGAEVSISLSFLVGWAQYSTERPLSRGRSALISLMGPLTQIVAAALVLWGFRLWLLPATSTEDALMYLDIHRAIMWSGFVIAGLNLLPLWPLDGGHIVEDLLIPQRDGAGRVAFLQWTLVAAAAMFLMSFADIAAADTVVGWTNDRLAESVAAPIPSVAMAGVGAALGFALSGSIFIPLFCGFSAWQALRSPRAARTAGGEPAPSPSATSAAETEQAVRSAERQGWATGEAATFPRGWSASPWLRAHVTLRRGGTAPQASSELAALSDGRRRWILDRFDRPEIGALLAYVPGTAAHCPAVVEARKYHGDPRDLVDAALATFSGSEAPEAYYSIAEGYAWRGLDDEALNWLRGAVDLSPDPRRISTSPLFRNLHGNGSFQQLRGVAERAAGDHPGGASTPPR